MKQIGFNVDIYRDLTCKVRYLLILYNCVLMNLKGPKLETFVSLVFTKIKPVWVGDLGTRSKNSNFYGSGLRIANLCFFALSPTSQKKFSALGDSA